MQIYFATSSTLAPYARRVAQLLEPEYTMHPWYCNVDKYNQKPEEWERLATQNTEAIRSAHSVYAFVDTCHPSMGTMFEIGLAQGLGKLRKIFEVKWRVDIGTVSKAEEEAGFKEKVEAVSQAIAKAIRAQEGEYAWARINPLCQKYSAT